MRPGGGAQAHLPTGRPTGCLLQSLGVAVGVESIPAQQQAWVAPVVRVSSSHCKRREGGLVGSRGQSGSGQAWEEAEVPPPQGVSVGHLCLPLPRGSWEGEGRRCSPQQWRQVWLWQKTSGQPG